MAEERNDDSLRPDGETAPQAPQKGKKNLGLLVMVAIAAVGLAYKQGFIGGTEPPEPAEQVRSAEGGNDDRGDEDQRSQSNDDGGLSISGPSRERAVEVLVKEQQQLNSNQSNLERRLERMERETAERLRQMEDRTDQRMAEITRLLEELSQERVLGNYRQGTSAGGRPNRSVLPPTDPLGSSGDDDSEGEEDQPRYAYTPLYGSPQRQAAESSREEAAQDLINFDPTSAGGQASGGSDSGESSSEGASAEDGSRESEDEVGYVEESVRIPAGSHLYVTNLHGVDCPVGGVADDSGGVLGPTPVTLVAQGQFRGPNGSEWDLGNVHLIGYCTGLSNSKRGRIKVERLSYSDSTGHSVDVAIDGYIQDRRDHGLDVAGYYYSTRGQKVAAAGASAGIAKMGQLASQSEFTFGFNEDGNVQSALTGNAFKAGAMQGIGSAFERISDLYVQEIEASQDRVYLPPAVPLVFHSLRSFEVTVRDYTEDV